MNFSLNKPEYLFQPRQLVLRLLRGSKAKVPRFESVRMPWGHSLDVNVSDTIGFALWHLGIYDLVVSEVLWRLIDPGDTALDVGANIGYMTSLMAARSGNSGRVIAFEPHPAIFQTLQRNVGGFRTRTFSQVSLMQLGASDRVGATNLVIPNEFSSNSGTAYLEDIHQDSLEKELRLDKISIELTRLDQVFSEKEKVQVTKIDTEGNELQVLQGAEKLLNARRMRDIVFESHSLYPTPVTDFLEAKGYSVFFLKKTLLKPILVPARDFVSNSSPLWEAISYLATSDPERARRRMADYGWKVLKG